MVDISTYFIICMKDLRAHLVNLSSAYVAAFKSLPFCWLDLDWAVPCGNLVFCVLGNVLCFLMQQIYKEDFKPPTRRNFYKENMALSLFCLVVQLCGAVVSKNSQRSRPSPESLHDHLLVISSYNNNDYYHHNDVIIIISIIINIRIPPEPLLVVSECIPADNLNI